jgi:hypothetical protein
LVDQPVIVIGQTDLFTYMDHATASREERFPAINRSVGYVQSETIKQLCRAVPALIVYGFTLIGIYCFLYAPKALFILAIITAIHCCQYALSLAYHGYRSLQKIKHAQSTNWKQVYMNHVGQSDLTDCAHDADDERITIKSSTIGWDDITHYVLVPNYKEHMNVLNASLEALSKCKMANTHVVIVLAMEEREESCVKKAQELIAQHGRNFKDMTYTVHPKDMPNEMAGKGSNDNFALKKFASKIDQRLKDRAIVTVADSDSCLHESYFEALTAKFLMSDEFERHNRVYQPIVTHYRNSDNVPAFTRVACQVSALFELSSAGCDHYHHMSYSTYSASLRFLEVYEAWDPVVICEDTHTYVTSYFLSGGKTCVEPIFLPVHSFCAEAESYFSSVLARFTQARRHSFGICEVAYCMRMIVANLTRFKKLKLPPMKTLTLLWRLTSPHLLPPIQLVFITLPAIYPQIYGYDEDLVYWINLFTSVQTLNFFCFFMAFLVSFYEIKTITGRPYNLLYFVKYYIEWCTIGPITSIVIGVVPCFMAVNKLLRSESYVYITAAKPSQTYALK